MQPEPPQIPGLTEWRPFARGGLARVWRARQVSLDRPVAVKVYDTQLNDRGQRRRFLEESAAAGRLSAHPNVVTVHDAGILPDGRPYLLMELYTAGSLARWLKSEDKPSETRVRDLGVRLAGALAAAHAAGVLHRDLKPSNVLVDPYGEPALADFGLAVVHHHQLETGDDPVHATPAYAPPEVLRGQRATEAGDVYSLAATLHALLAGRPFRRLSGGPLTKTELLQLAEQPVPPLPQVGWHLVGVLAGALDADPAARPTAAAFRDQLAALDLGSADYRPRRARAAEPGGHARRRLLVPLALVAALLAIVGPFTAWRLTQADSSVVGGPVAAAARPVAPASAGSAEEAPTPADSSPSVDAAALLAGCRERVQTADRVLREAEVGIGHWNAHVQAQTDLNAGKITGPEMGAIFTRTRTAGPADLQRYAKAVRSHARAEGTCAPVAGARAELSTALSRCAGRAQAQRPVLRAAEDAMGDWHHHLMAMQASRQHYVHDAQFGWIRTWRAAPPHLNAWKDAVEGLDAPAC